MKKYSIILIVSMCLVSFETPTRASDDILIQFMASDANWVDKSFTGHAFICIQLKLNDGLKEDCYGFYPRSSGRALIGGPGVVDNEFDFDKHPPTRFSNIKASVIKVISTQDRSSILTLIKEYEKDFKLTTSNCVKFTNEVAKKAGLKTPNSTDTTTPVSYIRKLQELTPGL